MSSSDKPSEEEVDQVRDVLTEEGPLTHDEIVTKTSMSDSEVKQALNDLWRNDIVFHTVDRQFDLKNKPDR